jgi:hypothetical protein
MNQTILRKYLRITKDDWNYITPIDFYNKYYVLQKDYCLIDLRSKAEYIQGHVK